MPIDPHSDKLILLGDIPKLPWLPLRNGKPISLSTFYRWIKDGFDGVKLETVTVGGAKCTTERAVMEFFQKRQAPAVVAGTIAAEPLRRQRIARERLAILGI